MKTATETRWGRRPCRPARRPAPPARPDLVRLDPVIHERTRLTILTLLSTTTDPGYSFSDLRDVLHLTDGNLMAHLRTLEEAELIERVKEGAGRASSTTIALSASGRKAFSSYLEQLEQLVRAARSK
ncbi:MAG TPA: transcriptional regulator [Planctomycetota bacterium]